MENDLKPCPFCGGEANLGFAPGSTKFYWGADGFEKSTPVLYRMICGGCHCSTEAAQDAKTAKMLWNRRVNDG